MEENVLHSDRDLLIKLFIAEDGERARVTIQSTKNGPDLSSREDVVVILDGHGLPLELEDRRHVHAPIEGWDRFAQRGCSLMIRVHEFFDGWEFEPEEGDAREGES